MRFLLFFAHYHNVTKHSRIAKNTRLRQMSVFYISLKFVNAVEFYHRLIHGLVFSILLIKNTLDFKNANVSMVTYYRFEINLLKCFPSLLILGKASRVNFW